MARLIDADAFKAEGRKLYREAGWDLRDIHYSQMDVECNIDMMPTIEAVPLEDYRSMEQTVHKLTQAIAEVEPRWIPCSERMPEEQKKSYWVCTDSGYQCECRWTNVNHFWTQLTTDWHWHLMDIPQYTKIVAWMPLPKPYKTDEVENG